MHLGGKDAWAFLVLITAAAGMGLLLWSSSGLGTFAEVHDTPTSASAPTFQRPLTLPRRLDALHDEVKVRPDQEPAWQRFVGVMSELDALTRVYERQVASGKPADAIKERGRHALIYGAAMNDMTDSLSPEQAVAFHRLARELAKSAVCRGLAKSS